MARLLIILVLLVSALPAAAVCSKRLGEAFAICVPEGAKFTRSDAIELDFVSYSIQGDGLPLILIYEGNWPQPMPRPGGVEIRRREVGEFAGVSHTYSSDGANVNFIRVRVGRDRWPEFVEFSFVTRTEQETRAAERLLASMSRRKRISR